MAATLFSDLYDLVRVATGNEDPILGVETLPNDRIDVLLKTAAFTFRSYSPDFPTLVVDSATPLTVALSSAPSDPLASTLITALVGAAAHRYFVGIANTKGISESLGMVYAAAEQWVTSGNPHANEADLAAAIIYKQRKNLEATAQTNLR